MSTRKDILANRETALNTITVANSYNYDIAEVTREIKHFRDIDNYPAAVIFIDSETREALDIGSIIIIADLRIRVRGIVKASANLDDLAEYFAEDIEKAMCNDITCGDLANFIETKDLRIYQASSDDIQIFDIDFIANYQYLYGSP